jgi:hypothetical protein
MDVSVATNPDGSETLILRDGSKSEGEGGASPSILLPGAPAPTLACGDPFFEQDAIAQKEFERMKGQDAASLAGHTPADAVSIAIFSASPPFFYSMI